MRRQLCDQVAVMGTSIAATGYLRWPLGVGSNACERVHDLSIMHFGLVYAPHDADLAVEAVGPVNGRLGVRHVVALCGPSVATIVTVYARHVNIESLQCTTSFTAAEVPILHDKEAQFI